jgi:hypothetical protein
MVESRADSRAPCALRCHYTTHQWRVVYRQPAGNSSCPKTRYNAPFTTCVRGCAMVSHLVFYQRGLIALVWVFLMLYGLWPLEPAAARPMTPKPLMPRGKHSKKPKSFLGLTRKPCCAACEQAIEATRLQPSPPPPPTITSIRGRRRQVDTSHHFCPDPDCRDGGWLGLGNITSNGHVQRASQWRPLATALLQQMSRVFS